MTEKTKSKRRIRIIPLLILVMVLLTGIFMAVVTLMPLEMLSFDTREPEQIIYNGQYVNGTAQLFVLDRDDPANSQQLTDHNDTIKMSSIRTRPGSSTISYVTQSRFQSTRTHTIWTLNVRTGEAQSHGDCSCDHAVLDDREERLAFIEYATRDSIQYRDVIVQNIADGERTLIHTYEIQDYTPSTVSIVAWRENSQQLVFVSAVDEPQRPITGGMETRGRVMSYDFRSQQLNIHTLWIPLNPGFTSPYGDMIYGSDRRDAVIIDRERRITLDRPTEFSDWQSPDRDLQRSPRQAFTSWYPDRESIIMREFWVHPDAMTDFIYTDMIRTHLLTGERELLLRSERDTFVDWLHYNADGTRYFYLTATVPDYTRQLVIHDITTGEEHVVEGDFYNMYWVGGSP